MQMIRVLMTFLLNCATPLAMVITYVTYGLVYSTINTRVTFTIFGFLNLLVGPFQNTGVAVIMLSAFLPSLGRIGNFYQSETQKSYVETINIRNDYDRNNNDNDKNKKINNKDNNDNNNDNEIEMNTNNDDDNSVPYISVTNGNFKWPKSDEETLKEINFKVEKNDKLLIVGMVGSGKSTILSALLGNVPKITGHVKVCGSMAYLPQTPWIYNATVR
jgi:ABC-type multidrug transport system fused ATPase/permease subunit